MIEGGEITAEMFLPDIVARYPATRAVLDRYGLHGCGGPQGPREQLGWFARLHGVPIDKLLGELNEAAQNPNAVSLASEPSIADTIYRPFFIAGLATVLTLGCVWGAINLATIGLRQNFSSVSYSWVLAHGHAMVTGFVGFFIMGFAYQAFPRFKHTSLWKPKLAFMSLPLMAVGIIIQTIAHLIVPSLGTQASSPAVLGPLVLEGIEAAIQLAAVIIFALAIIKTARQANKPEVYDRFVYAALAWFVVAAVANPIIF